MKIQPRTELCRTAIKAGVKLPEALKGWHDEQAFLWFKTKHPKIYNGVLDEYYGEQ